MEWGASDGVELRDMCRGEVRDAVAPRCPGLRGEGTWPGLGRRGARRERADGIFNVSDL
jgi:hypothetical protein